tara:strand:+ start:6150 stop:6398 length:249 start_codon:yes stop_codon:yes gene_type:complete
MNKKELLLTDEQKRDRGVNAEVLIKSPAYELCIQDMYDTLHEGLDCLPTDDPVPAMSILRQVRALRLLDDKLKVWARDAKND